MKNLIKGMIALLSILLLALVAVMTYALISGSDRLPIFGGFSDQLSYQRLINTQTVELEDVSDIVINNNSCDVIFLKSDHEEIIIKEYTSHKSDKSSFITVQKNGNTLSIESEQRKSNSWFVFGRGRNIEIYLPENYQDSMKIDTSSGDILAEIDLKFTDFSIDSTSGYIKVGELTAENIHMKTLSGDCFADRLSGEKKISTKSGYIRISGGSGNGEIVTSSGDVRLKDIDGSIDIITTSGFVNVDHLTGSAKVKTSSGDVKLTLLVLGGDLDIKCSSGAVHCQLPKETGFQFQANTTSGDIITNFNQSLSFNQKGTQASGMVGDFADVTVIVNTSSGDIGFSRK